MWLHVCVFGQTAHSAACVRIGKSSLCSSFTIQQFFAQLMPACFVILQALHHGNISLLAEQCPGERPEHGLLFMLCLILPCHNSTR